MLWSPFFHIYQPPDQDQNILERIVNESYRPLIRGWLNNPRAKLTLNINACLTEMLIKNNYRDVIDGFIQLAKRKQLEFTSSAKYHPFLPILPEKEIIRQIKINDYTNQKYFGPVFQPHGFFPPEMGYSEKVGRIVGKLGYQWIILDEIAYNGKTDQVQFDKLYRVQKTKDLLVFFRERRISNLIMSAMVRDKESLWEVLSREIKENQYIITAMDGETFGHHRPGLDLTLFDIYTDKRYDFVTISELVPLFSKTIDTASPTNCTWATSEKEIESKQNFFLYYRLNNPLHRLQKQMIDLAIKTRKKINSDKISRDTALDKALPCNHMWWSNPEAWWSLEEIERGAFSLKNVINNKKGDELYTKILEVAFNLQRSGQVKKLHEEKESYKKIPFSQRAKPGEYEALLAILKKEEETAVQKGEYEQAIRWRDSRYKLEKGLDVYDFVHVIDQLRAENRLGEYGKLAEEFKKKHHELVPGQPDK